MNPNKAYFKSLLDINHIIFPWDDLFHHRYFGKGEKNHRCRALRLVFVCVCVEEKLGSL